MREASRAVTGSPHRSGSGGLAARGYSPRPLTDGERWTAGALLELRDSGYRPAGWRSFIARSLTRAAETRRTRPELARQASGWGLAGAGAWIAACRLVARRSERSPKVLAGLLWWASVWKMLDWHLGMAEGGDGEPRKRLSSADAVSLFRFWLVPLLSPLRTTERAFPALIAVGGLSDWLDGVLARSRGRTRLGRDLDTTADLAFLGTAVAVAGAADRLPRLAAYALAARYATGTLLALVAVFGRARRPAVRARPWGGALRVSGLVLATAGLRRTGTVTLVAGCLVPPRSTAADTYDPELRRPPR
jgi:phosphatidylglycerophosphate synthase